MYTASGVDPRTLDLPPGGASNMVRKSLCNSTERDGAI